MLRSLSLFVALVLALCLVRGNSSMIDGEDEFGRELKRGGGGRSSGRSYSGSKSYKSYSGGSSGVILGGSYYYNRSYNRSYYNYNCDYNYTYNYSSKYEDAYNDCYGGDGRSLLAKIFGGIILCLFCSVGCCWVYRECLKISINRMTQKREENETCEMNER